MEELNKSAKWFCYEVLNNFEDEFNKYDESIKNRVLESYVEFYEGMAKILGA